MRGVPFTREQLLSATAILGGDNPPPTSGPSTTKHDEQLCRLIQCLLAGPSPTRGGNRFWCKKLTTEDVRYSVTIEGKGTSGE